MSLTNSSRKLSKSEPQPNSLSRSHVCVVCAKAYKTKSVLKTHMLIHSGEKRFECAICGQKFTLKGDCLNHQRSMHTNEKPHKCPHCDFCCTRSSHLKRHIRRHTGEMTTTKDLMSFLHKSFFRWKTLPMQWVLLCSCRLCHIETAFIDAHRRKAVCLWVSDYHAKFAHS